MFVLQVSSKDEDFFDLQVDVDQNTSITHCLKCFSNTETLCSDNKFKCDHCSSYQEAQVGSDCCYCHSAMLKWPAPSINMKYQVHTDLLYWFLSGRRKVEGYRLIHVDISVRIQLCCLRRAELLHSWRTCTEFFLYENE